MILAYSWEFFGGLVITIPGWEISKNDLIACKCSWWLWDAHRTAQSCHTAHRPKALKARELGCSKDLAICTERDSEIAPAWQLTGWLCPKRAWHGPQNPQTTEWDKNRIATNCPKLSLENTETPWNHQAFSSVKAMVSPYPLVTTNIAMENGP